MRVLLLTPPMTQLNTAYPATAYLKGFLNLHADWVVTEQHDLGLELALALFSRDGLKSAALEMKRGAKKGLEIAHFLENLDRYLETIDPTIQFLQGKDQTLAHRIVSREFLPEGGRFPPKDGATLDRLQWSFGALGLQDLAKHFASLYLDDLADVFKKGLDPKFEFTRYGEKLAASQPTFDPLQNELSNSNTWIDRWLKDWVQRIMNDFSPDVVAMSVPFPGNVYGAFRLAQEFKRFKRTGGSEIKLVLGGGYVNTELRELKDPRVFKVFDYILFDDGERPFLNLLQTLRKPQSRQAPTFLRTMLLENGKIVLRSDSSIRDFRHDEVGTPDYRGLKLDRYLSILEVLNPMHRIWSDGRWNKLTLAHGCYWKKCNFCDVTLDYIGRYETVTASHLCDQIETIIEQTGQSGFHFVDEAAPPALLKALALEILKRGLVLTWWGNIRFEKTFTKELCTLLAKSGCIAVSGGLEVASDRLLKLMNKGVTVEQVARVTHAFANAEILVHAYLMYGFPTQTLQETLDSLERVRQLFLGGCIQSGFWHRFTVTCHSPIGQNPEKFGISLNAEPPVTFARNDLSFLDEVQAPHDELGVGLRRALHNYMEGQGLGQDVRTWFPELKKMKFVLRKSGVPVDLVECALLKLVSKKPQF